MELRIISKITSPLRAHLAVLALGSFIVSFSVARIFTSLYPDVVIISGGLHIHHFWFGLTLLAVGGWLGINYTQKVIDMIAAIIYGVGGGLVADEIGLLLTFGNYYSELTWTFLLLLFSFILILIVLSRFRQTIFEELHEFIGSRASLLIGALVAAISVAFVVETNDILLTLISAILTAIGMLIILAFLIHQVRQNKAQKTNGENL